jgi:hypothetical protein
MVFFIVIAVKTSNLTCYYPVFCPNLGGYLAGVVEEIYIGFWVGCLVKNGCLEGRERRDKITRWILGNRFATIGGGWK